MSAPKYEFGELAAVWEGLIAFIVFLVAVYLMFAIKVLREYERAVKFRLGRFAGIKGPGIFLIVPILDRLRKVDLRTKRSTCPNSRWLLGTM